MTRRYGAKKRTQADKRAAALQFAVMADKTDEEKVATLVRSYGIKEPEAVAMVKRAKGNAA